MVSANGDRSASPRKKRRGTQMLTPADAGVKLREAREALGIDLAEVHDRTGVSWRNLDALESGDVARFSDPTAAAIAMRRYADLVSLDAEPLIRSLTVPTPALTGAKSRTSGIGSWATSTVPETSGHLRRYTTDQEHLRSFTQTAEVPAVPGGQAPGVYQPDFFGRRRHRRKAPLPLRLLTWTVVILLVVGGGGLAVYHYKPQWLREIHVLKEHPAQAAGKAKTKHPKKPSTTSTSSPAANASLIAATDTGKGTVNVNVATTDYTIVVTASNLCWVRAQSALSANPVVNTTLQPLQTVSIPVTGGQTMLELGALAAEITVKVGGTTVSNWSLRPNAVPFFVTFTGRSTN